MANKNEDINIVYSAIIRSKNKILSEFTECSGNFSQIIIHIMNEIILKFKDPPDIYRTYFFYGKYAIFLIKYKKIYILIMFPNVKINNTEIIFSLLYCLFDKLKSLKNTDLEKISKMRQYTLNFADIFKEQINIFNKNCSAFISYLRQSNEFILFEPFEDRYYESQIELPILSNLQVHQDKKNNEDIDKDENDISMGKSYNSIMTYDSFRDDILKQDKIEKLNEDSDNSNILITKSNESDNVGIKEKKSRDRDEFKYNKCKIIKWIFLIIFVVLILASISVGLYFYL